MSKSRDEILNGWSAAQDEVHRTVQLLTGLKMMLDDDGMMNVSQIEMLQVQCELALQQATEAQRKLYLS